MEYLLRSGERIRIETWNVRQLEEYANAHCSSIERSDGKDEIYEGFTYFRPRLFFKVGWEHPKLDYLGEENLSPLEIQVEKHHERKEYDCALVAFREDTLCGVFYLQWMKYSDRGFWAYHTRWLDVHEDHRNLGVGTALVRALDQVDFINNNILWIGMFTLDGNKYIKHVLERDLHAVDYALIFDDYYSDNPPMGPGRHRT